MKKILKKYYLYRIRYLMRRLRYYQSGHSYIHKTKLQYIIDMKAFDRVTSIRDQLVLYNRKVKGVY